MKRSIPFIVIIFLLLESSLIMAQEFEMFIYGGYTFGDNFTIDGGKAKIHDGLTFGTGFQYVVNDLYAVEALYHRHESQIVAKSNYLNLDVDLPMTVHFILAGSNRLLKIDEKASLFGGAKLGLVIYDPKSIKLDNVTHFAAGISAGGKYFIQPKLGLRLQANLLMPVTDYGGSIWWSPGSGLDVGLGSFAPILHFGFTGGLFFLIN